MATPAHVLTLMFIMEVFAMPQEDAAAVLQESGTGEARYGATVALMNAGKARLETLLCCGDKSGQRSVVESVDEVRYATDYTWGTIPPCPGAYETRNVGDTLEFEPSLSADGTICDLNLVPQRVRLTGFFPAYGLNHNPTTVIEPRFECQKFTSEMTLDVNQMEFLGTISRPPRFDEGVQNPPAEEVHLAFGKLAAIDLGAADLPTVDFSKLPPGAPQPPQPALEMELSFYSLDREAARRILMGSLDGDTCFDAVKALADKGQAKLERLALLQTESGQRAVVEEANEVRYATEFYPLASGSSGQSLNDPEPRAVETRNAGLTLEVEPTLGSDNKMVNINIVPQLVSYEGDLQNGVQIGPQPMFETRRITEAIVAAVGQHALLGTYSHPGDDGVNGRKDTGRTWFAFLQTRLSANGWK